MYAASGSDPDLSQSSIEKNSQKYVPSSQFSQYPTHTFRCDYRDRDHFTPHALSTCIAVRIPTPLQVYYPQNARHFYWLCSYHPRIMISPPHQKKVDTFLEYQRPVALVSCFLRILFLCVGGGGPMFRAHPSFLVLL